MKITGLRIDGFGVWSGLELNQFSEGINVFFGPNEAGKTTLMQFIRSVLYDFSPEGQRYLPPVNGGLAGGSVDISGASGQFRVSRHLDAEEDGGGQNLILTAADGTRQGEHFIKVLLCDVDRTLFRNVFAVGLKELQELGTLGDTDAAELLYRLTAGLDRVSLGEVMQALETSRRGLLEADSASCQITRLLAQREQLRGEIEELASLTRRFGQLASRRAGLDEEVTRQEEAQAEVDHQTRVVQLAAALAPRWRDRADLDDQLKALGPLPPIGEGAVERLDGLNSRLTRHEQAVDTLKQRHGELKTEAAGLGINEALWRQAARIEATAEQEPWIASLGQRVGELEAEIEQFQGQLTAGGEQLGLTPEAVAQGLP
ncbi:MAG: AAA family ATPase, partial [Planctomycetes bacterium]|nr:AAA family ATPase [Planctomycetota bacterium]